MFDELAAAQPEPVRIVGQLGIGDFKTVGPHTDAVGHPDGRPAVAGGLDDPDLGGIGDGVDLGHPAVMAGDERVHQVYRFPGGAAALQDQAGDVVVMEGRPVEGVPGVAVVVGHAHLVAVHTHPHAPAPQPVIPAPLIHGFEAEQLPGLAGGIDGNELHRQRGARGMFPVRLEVENLAGVDGVITVLAQDGHAVAGGSPGGAHHGAVGGRDLGHQQGRRQEDPADSGPDDATLHGSASGCIRLAATATRRRRVAWSRPPRDRDRIKNRKPPPPPRGRCRCRFDRCGQNCSCSRS